MTMDIFSIVDKCKKASSRALSHTKAMMFLTSNVFDNAVEGQVKTGTKK